MDKVYIKPNYIQETAPEEPHTELDYFLFVGRVEALKGIDVVVKAFENCRIRG